jgi:hypothetical protein
MIFILPSSLLPLLLRVLSDAEEVLQVFAAAGAHFVEKTVAAASPAVSFSISTFLNSFPTQSFNGNGGF